MSETTPTRKPRSTAVAKTTTRKPTSKEVAVLEIEPEVKAKPRKPKKASKTSAPKTKVRTRQQEAEIEELGLPPHVTSWEITPDPTGESENEFITFYADGEPTTYIELTVDNMGDMLTALNNSILIESGAEVTGWSLRTPEDSDLPTLFSLTSNGAILGILPLTDDVLKQLAPQIARLYSPNKKGWNSVKRWALKHRIAAGFWIMVLTVVIVYSAITVIF